MPKPVLQVAGAGKSFLLHLQGGADITVIDNVDFSVHAGECVVLGGPSGIGKSSLLKMIFGTYAAPRGRILVHHAGREIDVASAGPREVIALRREVIGYVSQFLRVIPRVAAIDLVMEPLTAAGEHDECARPRAEALLRRLNLPEALWTLPPATFSGGEKQRVNIALGFARPRPLLLLDEPTASLDRANREAVVALIADAKAAGSAILGVFHDVEVREAIADRIIDVAAFQPA